MAKILVVEDDISVSKTIKSSLEVEHHKIDVANNGADGLAYLQSFDYDLVILDRQLPDLSGTEICKTVRLKSNVPILFLTGLNSIVNKVEGLEAGADDYLTKPFDTRELVARVKALTRRGLENKSDLLSVGDIIVDVKTRKVQKLGQNISVTPREFDVLEFFLKNPNQVISPDALLKRVWGSETEASPHAVYNCLNRLRKNLDSSNKETYIKTVHGAGYRLDS